MKKIVFSTIGTIALLMALALNLRHSMNDYGLSGKANILAFADETNPGNSTAPDGKKYYRLNKTGSTCTLKITDTETRVTTDPIGATTVTSQTEITVSGLFYICIEATKETGSRSCKAQCIVK